MWRREDSQEVGLEAAILQRVRNSSLVEWRRAENDRGLSPAPKLRVWGMTPGGRGAFPMPMKADPRGRLEVREVRMPA